MVESNFDAVVDRAFVDEVLYTDQGPVSGHCVEYCVYFISVTNLVVLC